MSKKLWTIVGLGIPNTYLYLHDLRTAQALKFFWYLSAIIKDHNHNQP